MDTHEAGRRGGTARAKNLTPEQRREAAKKAALARWAKRAAHYTPPGAPAPSQKGSVP